MTKFGTDGSSRASDNPIAPGKQVMQAISCDDLEATIETLIGQGFRMEMIMPADSPCSAILSSGTKRLRLEQRKRPESQPRQGSDHREWKTGRAGMQYRDLIPGRLGGKLIASHIRLTEEGEVPDYVHYHKVKFQMIYCIRGAIRVVYEDQGAPFLLHPGDCVLQPPEIRHRVLWAKAGSEVVELGMPAVHETWVEHEITLTTARIDPDRRFNGQRFIRFIESESEWLRQPEGEFEYCETGIASATNGIADVKIFRVESPTNWPMVIETPSDRRINFCYVLDGSAEAVLPGNAAAELAVDDCFLEGADSVINLKSFSGFKALWVSI